MHDKVESLTEPEVIREGVKKTDLFGTKSQINPFF